MTPPGNHVRVSKPSPKSFNTNRPVTKNALLENQIRHFHELEKSLLKQLQTGIRFEDVRTEGDAAKYIRRVTEILHPHLAQGGGK
jgi:hypothetical protein